MNMRINNADINFAIDMLRHPQWGDESDIKGALEIAIESLKVCRKVLEQEPIIDKIRADIDKARFTDKDTRICKNALASGLEVALQIIDKYKSESE